MRLKGTLDFGATLLQSKNCPVCGQEWWIPAGFPPFTWSVDIVIQDNSASTDTNPITIVQAIPPSEQQTVGDQIIAGLQTSGSKLGLYATIGIIVVVIIVILYLRRK